MREPEVVSKFTTLLTSLSWRARLVSGKILPLSSVTLSRAFPNPSVDEIEACSIEAKASAWIDCVSRVVKFAMPEDNS